MLIQSLIVLVFSLSLISTYGGGRSFSVVQFSSLPILVRKIWNVFSITLLVSCSLHLMVHMKEKVKVNMLNSSCEQPKVLVELPWPQPPDFQLLFTWCFMLNCSTNGYKQKSTLAVIWFCAGIPLSHQLCFPWHSWSQILYWGHFPPSEVLPYSLLFRTCGCKRYFLFLQVCLYCVHVIEDSTKGFSVFIKSSKDSLSVLASIFVTEKVFS